MSSTGGLNSGERNPPLTSIRFFAALAVVLHHTAPSMFNGRPPSYLEGLLSQFGYMGVGFFFVLSGYVLAGAYSGRIDNVPNRTFWRARFARIYPLYILSLLLDVPRLLTDRIGRESITVAAAKTVFNFAGEAALISAWAPPSVFLALNFPSWSISAEAFFYALFPLLCRFMLRRTARELWLIATVSFAVPLTLAAVACILDPTLSDPSHRAVPTVYLFQYNPAVRVSEFILGICLYLVAGDPHGAARFPANTAFFASAAVLLSFPLVSGWFPFIIKHSALFGPLYALLIVGAARCTGALRTGLSGQTLVLLGEASYAVYLLHIPLWYLATARGPLTLAEYLGYLATLLAASTASYLLIETPARRYLTSRAGVVGAIT